MTKIKKILAPTDLSELSKAGVRYAFEAASAQDAETIVYNVIPYEETSILGTRVEWVDAHRDLPGLRPMLEERQRILLRFLRENFAPLLTRLRIRPDVDLGAPDKRILEKAAEEGVDIIVMSTHGRTGLSHMLLGSVTERVVRHAPCPVLSIRPEHKEAQRVTAAA